MIEIAPMARRVSDKATKYFAFPIQSMFTPRKNSIDRIQSRSVRHHRAPKGSGWQRQSPTASCELSAKTSAACEALSALNAQFCLLVHARQMPVENRSRYIDRRKQVGKETDDQSDRESLDRPGSKKEQKCGGNQRGDVRINNGQESPIESDRYRRRVGFAAAQFLADALEDQYVRIHAHTYS